MYQRHGRLPGIIQLKGDVHLRDMLILVQEAGTLRLNTKEGIIRLP